MMFADILVYVVIYFATMLGRRGRLRPLADAALLAAGAAYVLALRWFVPGWARWRRRRPMRAR